MPQQILERVSLAEAATSTDTRSGRMTIQVITPGQGSSGYYSPAVCESAAALVTTGTPMYLDHPSETDTYDRPERSLRDLAAVFTENARWDADAQAVVAECQVFTPYRDVLTEMAQFIGVSVRGGGEIIEGALPGGKRGRVVEKVTSISSVDFVTAAGRGGKVLKVLESARPSLVNARAVGHGLEESTVNDTREQLQTLLKDAYGAEKKWVYVRDFDDTTVWFEISADDGDGIYAQAYAQTSDGAVSLSGDRAEVRVVTTYVPVNPAGPSTTQESEEDTMPNIEESELARLREASGRVTALEERATTAEAERDEARTERDESRARIGATTRARTRVTEANATLPAATVDRIVEAATPPVPLTEAGQLDEAAFDTATDAARTSEETYLAGLAEAAGVGSVRNNPFTPPVREGDEKVTREDTGKAIAEAFGRTPNKNSQEG